MFGTGIHAHLPFTVSFALDSGAAMLIVSSVMGVPEPRRARRRLAGAGDFTL
jgi:hypothetical protein